LNKKISFLLFDKFNNLITNNPPNNPVGVLIISDNRLKMIHYSPRLVLMNLKPFFSLVSDKKADNYMKITHKKEAFNLSL